MLLSFKLDLPFFLGSKNRLNNPNILLVLCSEKNFLVKNDLIYHYKINTDNISYIKEMVIDMIIIINIALYYV